MSYSKLTSSIPKKIAYSEQLIEDISEGVDRVIISIDNLKLENDEQKTSFLNVGDLFVNDLQNCLYQLQSIVTSRRFSSDGIAKISSITQMIANLLLLIHLSLSDKEEVEDDDLGGYVKDNLDKSVDDDDNIDVKVDKLRSEFKASLKELVIESKTLVEIIKEEALFGDLSVLVDVVDTILTTIRKAELNIKMENSSTKDTIELLY